MTILYVTHLIGEVFRLADHVTVLRDGDVVLSEGVAALRPETVISAIAPSNRGADPDHAVAPPGASPGLELEHYATPGIDPLTLTVAEGAIVGIFGLLGSGRTELLEGIYGIRPREGTIRVAGMPYDARSPHQALRAGVALVAGDRLRQSMFMRLTALDNLLLPLMKRLARLRLRNKRRELDEFSMIGSQINLLPHAPQAPAWTFSGGTSRSSPSVAGSCPLRGYESSCWTSQRKASTSVLGEIYTA